MTDMQSALKERVRSLLEEGKIGCFIGWGATRFPKRTIPKFVFKPEQAEQLVYNEHCLNTLAKYTMDLQYESPVVGLAARGCEARAVNRLIADGRLSRDKVYIVGIPCEGMREKGEPAEKCIFCRHRNPVIYDELLGEKVAERQDPPRFEAVLELENKNGSERYEYWQRQFAKCIRCYACRNVCPACNCMECYTEQYRTGWQGKQANTVENSVFGFTRAYHIGDRCIECGECERVCPMEIPLMKLNRKLIKDVRDLFGTEESGLSGEELHALGSYNKEDLEEFM
ncbi:MAG: 4Fe-4S dicluster domain-containing protein [Clostridiales bacterium]|nr:4Fe-4S dicluster domain-containing protein [Clostridiales bacterium]